MTTVRDAWAMACPRCGEDSELFVTFTGTAKLYGDGTDDCGDHEWDKGSRCSCACGWDGSVGEAERTVTAENELPDHCQIVEHGDGWRYLFEGDDDDDPMVFPTYLGAVEAASRIG